MWQDPVNWKDSYGLWGTAYWTERHTHRNRHNVCPKKKPIDAPGRDYAHDHKGNPWKKDYVTTSKKHHGYDLGYRTYRGQGNYKGSQCTYDECGKLVDEGPHMGTYDYSSPTSDSVPDHFFDDFYPDLFEPNYEPGLTTTY